VFDLFSNRIDLYTENELTSVEDELYEELPPSFRIALD
jgi:hypothetical protein